MLFRSAMTCLTVKSSIQPINRPTGTDDDMAGNDKLTLAETWDARGLEALSALSFQTRPIPPGMAFYDTSRSGLHLSGTAKTNLTGGVATVFRRPW